MKLNKGVIIGSLAGVISITASIVFLLVFKIQNAFYFLFGFGILLFLLPFVMSSILDTKLKREKDMMFLEFARSLVESVESGTPISKSIINMRDKNFEGLNPHVSKLANQIELGIPLQQALETFSYDTGSKTIMRAVTLIREADRTGGNISTILESVAKSVSEIEKLKAERRAAISSIVIEGYIIFLVFIIIMVIMEMFILPMTAGITDISQNDFTQTSLTGNSSNKIDTSSFTLPFLVLILTQGFFAGLIIGQLAEGSLKSGIKHSFILMAMAVLISTGARLFL